MKTFILTFAVLTGILLSVSCKKATPTIIHGASLKQEELNFYPFQLNNLYIYKNSSGGTLKYKCVYIVHAWEDSTNAPQYCGPCDDHCNYTLYDGLSVQLNSDSLPDKPILLNIRTCIGPTVAQISCFNTLFQMDWNKASTCKVGLHYADITNSVNCISEFNLNSTIYTDVIKLESANTGSQVQTLYYSPTEGILQFTLNGDVWTLQ